MTVSHFTVDGGLTIIHFSCPLPASLTATQLTTVSPHSWLITKKLAVSAGAVNWILSIITFTSLDGSQCQTSSVNLVLVGPLIW